MKHALAATAIGALGLAAFGSADAYADLARIGPTVEVDSNHWYAVYSLDVTNIVPPVLAFNGFTITLKDPTTVPQTPQRPASTDKFDAPTVLSDFSAANWSQSSASATQAVATLSSGYMTDIHVTIHWTGTRENGAAFDIVVTRDGVAVANGFLYTKDGNPSYTDSQLQAIPLPPAVWMGLATLGAMGLFLLQRHHRRRSLV